SLSYTELSAYIRKIAADPQTGSEIAIVKSVRSVQHDQSYGLQIADLAVSGISQAFEPDPHGQCERSYIMAIAQRLFRPSGILLGNGLKLMGKKSAVDALVATALDWLTK